MTMLNEKCLVNGEAISLKIVVVLPMLKFYLSYVIVAKHPMHAHGVVIHPMHGKSDVLTCHN